MSMNLKKRKKILTLLPELILRNDRHGRDLLSKLKVNSFFSNYDLKASNELKDMIHLSTDRYKQIKNGETLKITIPESTKKLKDFSTRVLSDSLFFNNESIIKQKEKLKQSTDSPYDETIKDLIKQIRKSSSVENYISPQFKATKTALSSNKRSFSGVSIVEKAKRAMLHKLDEDNLYINKQIGNYMKKISNYNENPPDMIGKTRNAINLKESIKMLNYRKYNKKEKREVNVNEEDELSLKKINKILNDDYQTKPTKGIRIKFPKSNNNNAKYSDTVSILQKEAINNLFYNDKIVNNYNKIASMIDIEFPPIKEYERLIKQNIQAHKLSKGYSHSVKNIFTTKIQ